MSKKYLTILIIVIVVIIVGVIAVVLSTPKQPEQVTPAVVDNSVSQQIEHANSGQDQDKPEIITSDLDASNWQTYINEEFGFEFRYPREWGVVENTDSKIIGLLPPGRNQAIEYNGDISFFVRANPGGGKIEEVYDGSIGPELFRSATGGYSKVEVDQKQAIYFKSVMGLMSSDIVIIILRNEFLEIHAFDSYEIFRAILKNLSFY